ncbi:MAG: TraR/DksA C4-type zinc finger protein [Alphaproteobacteria bacterium]|nr:TraR/DksA C4-type zinc finger protein [Alphaproteobacteria bacterium]
MTPTIYKTTLLKEREEIEKSLAMAAESSKPVELDQTTQGRVSRIDAIQQQEMILAAQRRREQRLLMIDSALKRIESGDFGYCISCDEDIPEKRLALDPATLKCISCADV